MSENGNNDFGQTSPGGGGSLRLDQQGSMPVAGQELRRHLRRAGMVTELSGLSDIDFDSAEPADGQSLVYNTTTEVWAPGAVPGVPSDDSVTTAKIADDAITTVKIADDAVTTAKIADATLVALAGLATGSDKLPYSTGTDAFSQTTLTAFARTLLDDADAAAVRTTLSAQTSDPILTSIVSTGIAANELLYGTDSDTFGKASITAFARTLLDDADAGAVRTTISAQALDATLTALAGLATGADKIPYSTGTDAFSQATLTSFARTLIAATTAEAVRQILDVGNTEQHAVWWQDYLVSSMTACGWSTKSINGGTGQSWESISDASNATGVNELRTNTNSSGMYSILSYNDALIFNNQTAYTFEGRVNLSALSTEDDPYVATFGFSRQFNAAYGDSNETDYAMFVYDQTNDGNLWSCHTAKDGTETKTRTSSAVTGDNSTFVVLKIEVAADGSSVTYSIGGSVVATHTSNIPSTGDRLGIGLRINKLGGTTNREFRIDWHRFTSTRTAAR